MIAAPPIDRLARATVAPDTPLGDAIARLEAAETGALVVCTADGTLDGLVTDGDVRRAILRGLPLTTPCSEIASRDPVVAPADASAADALRLMDRGREFVLDHLPLVDDARHVVGLLLRSDLVTDERLGISAVIMAGGFGTRLRPLTDHTPKPMLPIGDRPLLEHTIGRLRDAGIRRVRISTHYLAEQITEHFGDGHAFGVDVQYVAEDRPLGTAGALRLLGTPDEPLLVINGDVLTGVHFREMLAYHREHRAVATVGVRKYEFQVPFGVIECDGPRATALREKPRLGFLVNAGVYLLDPRAHGFIPSGERFDMTDLIQRLLDAGEPVVSFPITEYWMDIGQPADYARAQDDARCARFGHGAAAGGAS